MQQGVKIWQVIVAVVVLVIIVGALGWFWFRPKQPEITPEEEAQMEQAIQMEQQRFGPSGPPTEH